MSRAKTKAQLKVRVSLRSAEFAEIVSILRDFAVRVEEEVGDGCEEAVSIIGMARRLEEGTTRALRQKLKQVGPR